MVEFCWDYFELYFVYYWYIIVEDSFNGKMKLLIWKFKMKKEIYCFVLDQLDFCYVFNF